MTDPSRIIIGDVIEGLRTLDAGSVQCCVTSPPYWGLRDYGVEGQIGLEKTPDEYVAKMVDVFREVRRVLRDDGTLWLNLGDCYAGGPKTKDLGMIPWRVALALQADGWWLRSVIVWAKKSPMPESVTDRPTSSFEPIFLLAKSERYFYDAEAVKETAIHAGTDQTFTTHYKSARADWKPSGNEANGAVLQYATRNQRNVWHLGPEPYAEAHFATFPTEIPRRAIKAGTSEKGCCAACGAGWVRVVERSKYSPEVVAAGVRNVDESRGDKVRKLSGKEYNEQASSKTTGWQPGCTCGADVVPCMVLDPFLGSGTTVAVARELGRYGVGCELNPEYAKLARDRIGKAEKPSTYRSDRVDDAPLFVP